MKKTYKLGILLFLVAIVCHAQVDRTQWIGHLPQAGESMPMLRKTLNLQQVPSTAVMTATALGIYDVTVNGMPVSQHELKPGWTDYRKEVTSQCIDISGALRKGENVICVQLSRGWWAGDINRGGYGAHLPLMFRANIEVDGKILAQTDTTWQCSTDGPLLLGDIYLGEYYDARRLHPTWHAAKVTTVSAMPNVLPFEGPDVRIRDKQLWRHPHTITIYCDTISTGTTYGHIKPLRILGNKSFTLHRGETAVIDLGQNMVGWMWFDAKAKQGTEMTLRHGEMLNYNGDANRLDQGPGGSVWTYNLRTADALLKYVFRGEKRGEKYRPHHTFMGFRYVSITATDDVEIRRLVGQVVGSDIKEWGEFECSDASVNQLYKNIWWGQRGNFLSVPTDCPQRDERLGWTGDTQIFSRTALYQSDVSDFYRKWMRDMRNSQREDGAYPDIAPYVKFWGFGTAAWGDAGVIVPWNVYDMTGDKTILVENYESMTRWMQWLSHQQETVGSTTYRHIGAGTATGDWLAYEELEPRYVAVAYYAYVAQLMDSIATALGKTDDALHYRHLYQDIREEFQQRYLTQDGQLTQTTQTAYLLALHLDLLPLQHRKAAYAALRRKIEQNGYKLSTGFVGTGMLCTTLSQLGMDDLAYALLLQRDNPSWLYSIDQGATTVWERWDSYTREHGFHQHPWNMNSFNHYAYGAVAEWLYAYVGGIRPALPGFQRVILNPHADRRPADHPSLSTQSRITWARTKVHTPQGDITSSWRLTRGHYKYSFTLPKGLNYELRIPDLQPGDQVFVNGKLHH